MKEASFRCSWVSAEQRLRVGASGDQARALLLRHTAVKGQGWDSTPNPASSQVSHFLEPHDAHECRRSGSVGVMPVQGEGPLLGCLQTKPGATPRRAPEQRSLLKGHVSGASPICLSDRHVPRSGGPLSEHPRAA